MKLLSMAELEGAVQRLWTGDFPVGCNGKFAAASDVGLDLRNHALPVEIRAGHWTPIREDLEVFIEARAVGSFVPRLHVRRQEGGMA